MLLSIIVAVSRNNAIGKDNQLLWHMPADLKFFKRTTSGHSVIMGRKTFESLGKALPKRRNIVISRQENYQPEGAELSPSLEEAINRCREDGEVFILGGAEIYRQALEHTDKIYQTVIQHEFEDADAFFPVLKDEDWALDDVQHHEGDDQNPYDYSFYTYTKTT